MACVHRPLTPASADPAARRLRGGAVPRRPGAGRGWPVVLVCVGVLATLMFLGGCASTGPAPVDGWGAQRSGVRGAVRVPKGFYRVRKGDSLGGIARKRRISVDHLIRWNGLKPPYTLYVGRVLRVVAPRSAGSRGARVAGRPRAAAPRSGAARPSAPVQVAPVAPGSRAGASSVVWAWPLTGAVIQGFRPGDPARTGLRISCRAGEEVHAAGAGAVVYSGSGLKGYGNLIIVKHNKNYLSAYGFNRRLFLKEGGSVTRGQALAECGEGPGGTPLLHFEVRRDGASVNPLLYLPPRE